MREARVTSIRREGGREGGGVAWAPGRWAILRTGLCDGTDLRGGVQEASVLTRDRFGVHMSALVKFGKPRLG